MQKELILATKINSDIDVRLPASPVLIDFAEMAGQGLTAMSEALGYGSPAAAAAASQ